MKIRDFNKLSKEERLKLKFKELPWPNKYIPLAFLLFFLIGLGKCISSGGGADTPPSSAEVARLAVSAAEPAVRAILKAPASASFVPDPQVLLNSDSTATVNGQVDAQNAFGAMLRTSYSVHLKYIGDPYSPGSWLTLSAVLIE